MTPFAAAAGATGSPGAAARTAATAGTSGRPLVRRIGDLLSNPAPSTRRIKQKSIASFLCSPAAVGGSMATGGGGSAATATRSGARDLAASGAPRSSGKRGSPLPAGLGAASLTSPRSAKRLRTTFEAAGGAGGEPGSAKAAAARLAAAAAALEPSPELSKAAAAGAGAGALSMQRKDSNAENLLENL